MSPGARMIASDPVRVAVGVIRNDHGQVLISERPAEKPHGGCWEFPGGKFKAGETIEQALRRELLEELNLTLDASRPLINIHHDYGGYPVLLDVHLVYAWHGEIHGREGQACRWVDQDKLGAYRFPAANVHILKALSLPEFYCITPEAEIFALGFLEHCESILDSGCRLMQFRCRNRSGVRVDAVFAELLKLCHSYDCRLLINDSLEHALALGADGCHLNSARLQVCHEAPRPADFTVAASCHNAQDLTQAQKLGLDFAVLGPVQKTASHPDTAGIGWVSFAALVAGVSLPVYAIGGMRIRDLDRAWTYGAHGLASISAIWNDRGRTRLDSIEGRKMVSA